MSTLTLIIGNKNYSSWSLRPWLFLRHHGIAFQEMPVSLYTDAGTAQLRSASPSGLVPVLRDDALVVWDSLAICEYLAETYPQTNGWPRAAAPRAVARSVSAEMHAGFRELRSVCSMNIRARYRWKGGNAVLEQEVKRIEQIWSECRARFGQGGPWLFGHFTIADAMFAPVAFRFETYDVPIGSEAREYVQTILTHPAAREWAETARQEREIIPQYEFSDREHT